ncbi:MAG: hypothetical protein GY774_16450 [Planctomycetes bacterium]|nr:hypothetical protein [Planctomycetota bacterium]
MKRYLLFTKDDFAEYYYVFQGDFNTLDKAFRGTGQIAHESGKLCLYRIISRVSGMPDRCVASGFINPGALTSIKEVEKCEV